MQPKKDPRYATTRRYGNTRRLTLTTPRFAEGKESPADRPPDAVRSLNPTGVNETSHPSGKGVTTPLEAPMAFTLADAVTDRPLTVLVSRRIAPYGTIIVTGTKSGHYLVRIKPDHGTAQDMCACETKGDLVQFLNYKLSSGAFAEILWAFVGKVW